MEFHIVELCLMMIRRARFNSHNGPEFITALDNAEAALKALARFY